MNAGNVGGLFPPTKIYLHQSDTLRSNSLLEKISWAGGNCASYPQASRALEVLAGIHITPCQVARITEQIGKELAISEDRISAQTELELEDRSRVAAVLSVDGGRVQIRAEDQLQGVHQPQWKETRVAHLQIMETQPQMHDPQPQVPASFVNQSHVQAMVRQLSGNGRSVSKERGGITLLPKHAPPRKKEAVLLKSCLATMASAEEFAPLIRNEVHRLQMEKIPNKIFLGDGGASNWLIYETFFPHWHAALDFVHLVEHIFHVAGAVYKNAAQAWNLYLKLIHLAWNGKPKEILEILLTHQKQIGPTQKGLSINDPRLILHRAIGYIQNNQNRMDYPNLRKLGLPITSSRVESLIKQINQRIKASDKFWIIPNLKAILKIRAAELSSTKKWEKFWQAKMAA